MAIDYLVLSKRERVENVKNSGRAGGRVRVWVCMRGRGVCVCEAVCVRGRENVCV